MMGHLQDCIIKQLKKHKQLTVKEMSQLCDTALCNIWQSLMRLQKWGIVLRIDKNGKTYWRLKKEVM